MLKIVVLILTVWDASTGALLFEKSIEPTVFSLTGDRIEDCRLAGIEWANKLTRHYQKTYPNAFTNVDCHWENRLGDPA